MQERRKDHRGRTYLGAQITFNNRFSTTDCLVRNMSQNGAKIVFPSSLAVPDEFDIQIHNKGESKRARMIWRNETELGVVIIQPNLSPVVSIETARRIKKLEADRDALMKRVAELSEPS